MPDEDPPTSDTASLEVSDLGGIDHAEVELAPGLTTLAGRNATNRSSLLLALNEALGGEMGSVRRGSDGRGLVELELDGETYTRTLNKKADSITRDGRPFSAESTIVDLYVSLVDSNRIRRLVETGDKEEIDTQLAELLMAPVDVDEIAAEIDERQRRLGEVEQRLAAIEEAKDELPDLEARREELAETRDSLAEQIETTREQLAAVDIDETAAEEAQQLLADLQSAQEERHDLESTLDRKRQSLEEERETLAARRDDLAEVEKQLEDLSVPDEAEVEAVGERKREFSRAASALDGFAEACRGLVSTDADLPLPDDLDGSADPTAALVPDAEEIDCPACGRPVEQGMVEDRIERLEAAAAEYERKSRELDSRRSELQTERDERERLERERDTRESEMRRLEHRIEETEQRIKELEADLEAKCEEIETLEEEVESAEARRDDEFEELHDELAELQSERAAVEADLSEADDKISRHESILSDESDLREELATLEAEIDERRARINDLEEQAQQALTDHMDALVERLEYERLEGARIARKPTDDPHELSEFELVISRRQREGAVVEEHDVTTLSESERSLLGLVVGLAGYVTHEVAEDVPFLLLDSIEQFDADRIDALLGYVRAELDVRYVVAALLPGDADGLETEGTEIPADALG